MSQLYRHPPSLDQVAAFREAVRRNAVHTNATCRGLGHLCDGCINDGLMAVLPPRPLTTPPPGEGALMDENAERMRALFFEWRGDVPLWEFFARRGVVASPESCSYCRERPATTVCECECYGGERTTCHPKSPAPGCVNGLPICEPCAEGIRGTTFPPSENSESLNIRRSARPQQGNQEDG